MSWKGENMEKFCKYSAHIRNSQKTLKSTQNVILRVEKCL